MPTKRKKKGKRVRYPWDTWIGQIQEGETLVFLKGRDYNCMTHCFYIMIRNAAKHRGVSIKTQTRNNGKALEVSVA